MNLKENQQGQKNGFHWIYNEFKQTSGQGRQTFINTDSKKNYQAKQILLCQNLLYQLELQKFKK